MTASLRHPPQPQRSVAGLHASALTPLAPNPLASTPRAAELVHGSQSLRLVAQPEGLLQVHTAPFRGSFAVVFSQALRAAGLGSRVLISQFLKGGVDQGVQRSLTLCGRLQWLRPAVPACLDGPLPADPELASAAQAVAEVWDYTREQLLSGMVDLMVLDELGLAIAYGYVALEEAIEALQCRPAQMDVILTGPSIPADLVAMADQVTQLRRGF